MVSSRTFSKIERRPRAPVLRSSAFLATARRAESSNTRSTSSILKRYWYWRVNAFLGSVRICISASSSSSSSVAITGRRPINSGIKPNLTRSAGSTWRNSSASFLVSSLLFTSAVKPIPPFSWRCCTIFSNPEKAPPQINRTFEVSTWINSCCGCLRPPWGGIEATVPSIIFSKACWTPSPETSRVIDGFSDLRVILSISSI